MVQAGDCGSSTSTDGDQCVRRYMMYVPNIVCNFDYNERENTVDGGSGGILPIWMAIHCLGCSPSTFFYMKDIAETYKMILVIPEGLHRSFNADHCCGYSLEHNVNDVGFLQRIIETLEARYSKKVHRSVVYGMGWSNGGYMVMKAASLFRAIAPIAGYQVDLPTSESDQLLLPAISLFLHHSADDRFVQPTGCCRDPTMPKCCCHLSDYSEECRSVDAQVEAWARVINRCDDDHPEVIVSLRIEDNYECRTFASGSCQANTTYCIHQHKGHFNQPSFEASFPMSFDVADYFARDACGLGGGTWDNQQRYCHCLSTAAPSPYCLDSSMFPSYTTSKDDDITYDVPSSDESSRAKAVSSKDPPGFASARVLTFFICSTSFAAVVVTMCYWKHNRRLVGFQKVPASSSALEMRSL